MHMIYTTGHDWFTMHDDLLRITYSTESKKFFNFTLIFWIQDKKQGKYAKNLIFH